MSMEVASTHPETAALEAEVFAAVYPWFQALLHDSNTYAHGSNTAGGGQRRRGSNGYIPQFTVGEDDEPIADGGGDSGAVFPRDADASGGLLAGSADVSGGVFSGDADTPGGPLTGSAAASRGATIVVSDGIPADVSWGTPNGVGAAHEHSDRGCPLPGGRSLEGQTHTGTNQTTASHPRPQALLAEAKTPRVRVLWRKAGSLETEV